MFEDIWIVAQTREGKIEKSTFGLLGEAHRLFAEEKKDGVVTVVVMGVEKETELTELGQYGADKVLWGQCEEMASCESEYYAEALFDLCARYQPSCVLMSQAPENMDFGPRLAALLEASFISGAVDLHVNSEGVGHAVRMVANGHLFEELSFSCSPMPIISLQSHVLTPLAPNLDAEFKIYTEVIHVDPARLKTKTVRTLAANPENVDLEEAEIIILGGRGIGSGEDFAIIQQLAEALGGAVGGSRPVIDQNVLPFERQIGQTGKTVEPRLLVACGVSGANELTVGFEDAEIVVAINTDQRARIFRFADLGIVGDVHKVVPLLLSSLDSKQKNSTTAP